MARELGTVECAPSIDQLAFRGTISAAFCVVDSMASGDPLKAGVADQDFKDRVGASECASLFADALQCPRQPS